MYTDWNLSFADYFIMQKGSVIYKNDEPCWLIPDIQGAGANAKVTAMIKAMQPTGKTGALERYKDFSVKSLPNDPTAAGIRPGACDSLAIAMPPEIMRQGTGHEMKQFSAMYEYLSVNVGLTIPAALVLAGWKPAPYGQLSKGPTAPSLEALICMGVGEDTLNNTTSLQQL